MMQHEYLTLDAVAIDIVAHMKDCNADYEHYRRIRALGAVALHLLTARQRRRLATNETLTGKIKS